MKKTKDIIINKLSHILGVEPTDISDDDAIVSDLKMSRADFDDLLDELERIGIATEGVERKRILTVGDLIDEIDLLNDF